MNIIKTNIKTVLKRRGYKIEGEIEPTEGISFIILFTGGKVIYCEDDKLSSDSLQKIFAPIINDKIHIILIYREITNPCQKEFKNIKSYRKYPTELIKDSYFIQDIMSHPLIPQYKVLTETEKNNVLTLYKTEEDKFPQLKIDDPISIIMGYRLGQMIRIESKYNFTKKCIDEEMPPSIGYRIITE